MKKTMNKFWNVKTEGNSSQIDLFGYVGGSKEGGFWEPEGFNEKEFLEEIRSIPNDNALNISINSTGGSVFTALSIYALLKAHKGAINIRIDGVAMSAATIISSVPNAKVVMPKGSMMMIHKVSSLAIGTADDMRKAAEDMEAIENNILDIYAEKTGKTVDEIKPLVDAETYFTATEALEFGLADEVDETTIIENKMVGDVVMVNGLEVNAQLFERAPKGFFNADKLSKQPAFQNTTNKNKEVKDMTIETLKAEHPEIVEAIRKEALEEGVMQGTKAENARIKAIEEIAVIGHEDLVNQAKFGETTMSAEQLAVAILKADKVRNQKMLNNREQDAKDLNDIPPASNQGIENSKPKTREEIIAEERQKFNEAKNA